MEIQADRVKHLKMLMMQCEPYKLTKSSENFLVLFVMGSMI